MTSDREERPRAQSLGVGEFLSGGAPGEDGGIEWAGALLLLDSTGYDDSRFRRDRQRDGAHQEEGEEEPDAEGEPGHGQG